MTKKRSRSAKARTPTPAPNYVPNRVLPVPVNPEDAPAVKARDVARRIAAPETSAYRVISAAEGNGNVGAMLDANGMVAELRALQKAVNAGDLSGAENMLMAQALGLQSLYVRLVERAMQQEWVPQFETFMRLGLKAQAQSRMAIEALAALKHGPAVLAHNMQMNVAQGPQQVNNVPPLPLKAEAVSYAPAFEIPPSKLLSTHGENMDPATTSGAGRGDPALVPMESIDRPSNQ